MIGNKAIPGFIAEEKHSCGEKQIYHEKYDAYFCPKCNVWLEHSYQDNTCDYCKGRPSDPL
ncbi:MAG: hypothetical protein ACPGO5_03275 [Patescibacteria group bacterium]